MKRSDLIEQVRNRSDLTPLEADWLVRQFCEILSQALCEGRRVELRGLGRFTVHRRRQADFLNPVSGERVQGRLIRQVRFLSFAPPEPGEPPPPACCD